MGTNFVALGRLGRSESGNTQIATCQSVVGPALLPTVIREISNRFLMVFVLVTLTNAGGVAADWPQFRGNPRLTGVATSPAPKTFKVLWTWGAGDGIESSPAIAGNSVYVGSLNFELLKPLPGGESLFHDHLANRGESIASIASMFHEREDGDAFKRAFKQEFGLELFNKANIGDHIEYYYVDSQEAFGCPIESGSGHAIDFAGPARVHPHPDAKFGPSPDSGITCERESCASPVPGGMSNTR